MGPTLTLDADLSSLRIHTFAEGLFARLAHDLAIEGRVTGTATQDADVSTAQLVVERSSLRVVGVVKKGQVDRGILSVSDRADIDGRMVRDVLVKSPTIAVDVELRGRRATLQLLGATVRGDVSTATENGAVVVAGRLDLSLKALGLPTVKGPMGAFKLSDRVEVVFRAVFRA